MELPAIEKISESQQDDPFQILIATLLSARTQDATTHAASTRLFARARTPRSDGQACRSGRSRQLIYPVSFYRNKAVHVKATAAMLVDAVRRPVPSTLEELVTLPGVGRKTANLVMILAFKSRRAHLRGHARAPHLQPAGLGADEDCRRRPSRRSIATTDARWWPLINLYLVTWGQNVCRPVYPRCGECAIAAVCPRSVRQIPSGTNR